MKEFLYRYAKHGEIKQLAIRAGIHPNTVYTWIASRNYPSVLLLVWFFRALSEHTGVPYEHIWLDFIYTMEGGNNAYQESKRWIQSSEHQEQANEQSESEEAASSNLRKQKEKR